MSSRTNGPTPGSNARPKATPTPSRRRGQPSRLKTSTHLFPSVNSSPWLLTMVTTKAVAGQSRPGRCAIAVGTGGPGPAGLISLHSTKTRRSRSVATRRGPQTWPSTKRMRQDRAPERRPHSQDSMADPWKRSLRFQLGHEVVGVRASSQARQSQDQYLLANQVVHRRHPPARVRASARNSTIRSLRTTANSARTPTIMSVPFNAVVSPLTGTSPGQPQTLSASAASSRPARADIELDKYSQPSPRSASDLGLKTRSATFGTTLPPS